MGKIFYIMGKSSSGKDTIFKRLTQELNYKTIILYTTRPIRDGETNGTEYYFVDELALADLEKKGRVIEVRAYNTKCGIWKYFTADDGQIDLKNYDYIVIGTLQSYQAMCRYFGNNRLVPIYIEVEDGERLQRALHRERLQSDPKYAELCRRFLADEEDFSEENLREAGVTKRFQNTSVDECLDKIRRYIQGFE
ncbi:nucleoside/nucleotide kinase family protein [Luxibacter massiliensis]|uniref:guanylate kinase n=1 Tax=Luxibacter massiliensis TaxID=2219695 RepID=UPI000F05A430|nr:guanylate kinase [Luxibacter massiliensis]